MIFVLILPNLFFFFHQLIILPIHLKYDLSEAFVKYERFKLNKSNNKTSYQRHEKEPFSLMLDSSLPVFGLNIFS